LPAAAASLSPNCVKPSEPESGRQDPDTRSENLMTQKNCISLPALPVSRRWQRVTCRRRTSPCRHSLHLCLRVSSYDVAERVDHGVIAPFMLPTFRTTRVLYKISRDTEFLIKRSLLSVSQEQLEAIEIGNEPIRRISVSLVGALSADSRVRSSDCSVAGCLDKGCHFRKPHRSRPSGTKEANSD
jgi:hypothetical protein